MAHYDTMNNSRKSYHQGVFCLIKKRRNKKTKHVFLRAKKYYKKAKIQKNFHGLRSTNPFEMHLFHSTKIKIYPKEQKIASGGRNIQNNIIIILKIITLYRMFRRCFYRRRPKFVVPLYIFFIFILWKTMHFEWIC